MYNGSALRRAKINFNVASWEWKKRNMVILEVCVTFAFFKIGLYCLNRSAVDRK